MENNKNISSWITIEEVVANIIGMDLGMDAITEKKRISQIVIHEYSHRINMGYVNSLKRKMLKVLSNGTAILPDDYIEYRRIGVIRRDRIVDLTKNDNIAIVREYDCGTEKTKPLPTVTLDNTWDESLMFSWYQNDIYTPFGEQGNKVIGEFRIDSENNRIELGTKLRDNQILLEYISTGISTDKTLIPSVCLDALIECVEYRLIKNDKTVQLGEKQQKKVDRNEALDDLFATTYSFNISELYDILRKNTHLGIKR